jgi:uncharacterized protein (TIGR02001 family)
MMVLIPAACTAGAARADDAGAPQSGTAAQGTAPAAAPAAPDPAGSWTADLGVYTDYVARGLSYTSERTLFAGHAEYDWARGPYVGAYLNHFTIVAGAESLEFDPYGGWLFAAGDVTFDLGLFSWWYPHRQLPVTHALYDSFEGYVGASYKIAGVRFWYDLLDYFGLNTSTAAANYGLPPNGSSKGSAYLELNLNLPLPHSITLTAHAGHQWIRHYGQLDFTDVLLGVQKDFGDGLVAGINRTDTTGQARYYTDSRGINAARDKWIFFVKKTFP